MLALDGKETEQETVKKGRFFFRNIIAVDPNRMSHHLTVLTHGKLNRGWAKFYIITK